MPRVTKTIIPRIKKSLQERGLVTSLFRSFLLPVHLFREYRAARLLRPNGHVSEFDREYGVDTEGRFEGWTYLSDLDIPSPNWIDGNDYLAIEPERFRRVLASFDIALRVSRSSILGPARAGRCCRRRSTRSIGYWDWNSHENYTELPKTTSSGSSRRIRSAGTSSL